MTTNLSQYDVIVFDLDDTLYNEIEYVKSGYQYLSDHIKRLYGKSTETLFFDCLDVGNSDTIGEVLKQYDLPACIKNDLIYLYRYHTPSINLNNGVKSLLDYLFENNKPLYIVTDGRSITQRQKIEALEINDYFQDVFISQEIGVKKPDTTSFNLIGSHYPASKIVYIGDNPAKDFIAPRKLGWKTIGVLNLNNRIHSLPDDYNLSADLWVEHIWDLTC